ncbi:hypothetical protein [Dysgonomonas termitidis]|uniref:Uncharacterized protein n=1 Tax=Dysgonomonas termitidis TaxID=1516126 RepID=A0ABV9KR87_9BACT
MIKDYIQLGPYAFIEIPSKEKADKYITELGICSHKWNEDNIEYGFSRYGIQNQFIINFYVAVGLGYHIYNIFIDAIEAGCYGVTRTDGAFWEENILGNNYPDEDKIKPGTEYIVVKILLTFPLKHITEIIQYHDKERTKLCKHGVVTTFGALGPINTYMGKEIGRAMTDEQISDFMTKKYNFHLLEYCNCTKYLEHLTPQNEKTDENP